MSAHCPYLSRIAAALFLASVCALSASPASASRPGNEIAIKPGPTEMSPAERAIVAEPEKGIEHAVILIEESDRDDTDLPGYRFQYHLRAKVLSNAARSIGDITIPLIEEAGTLWTFWAIVIKPDGSVREFGEDLLEQQLVAETAGGSATILKATLPGVEPGCVIDFGYEIVSSNWSPPSPVALQSHWPVRLLRYRWKPSARIPSAYLISGTGTIPGTIEKTRNVVLITADNIPPFREEKYMPPAFEVKTHFVPYYRDSRKEGIGYWHEAAKKVETSLDKFCGSSSKRKKALAEIGVPADVDLQTQLRFLYDWILQNIDNTFLRTADQRAAAALEKKVDRVKNLRGLLSLRRGSRWQITLMFTGLARELGAEAFVVKAVNRTERYFHPDLLSQGQFSTYFVEVKEIPAASAGFLRLDPGNAMPYGQVPWWITGSGGFKSTPKGAKTSQEAITTPEQNRILAKATIGFTDDNEIMTMNWSIRASGQALLTKRAALRQMPEHKREEWLRELCGESAQFEVHSATTGDLKPLAADYELACSGERFGTNLDEEVGRYHMTFDGGWIQPIVDLHPGPRARKVNLPYCETEEAEILIRSPEGFEAEQAFAPLNIDSPYGSYSLVASKRDDGFLVRRKYVLHQSVVEPSDYKAFVEFLEAIRRADDSSLVFIRTSEPGP